MTNTVTPINNTTTSSDPIDNVCNSLRPIFQATLDIHNAMAEGDRKFVGDIVKEVCTALSSEPKKVAMFVNHFLHNNGMGYVSQGPNGGYIKGQRPVKATPPPATTTTEITTPKEVANEVINTTIEATPIVMVEAAPSAVEEDLEDAIAI